MKNIPFQDACPIEIVVSLQQQMEHFQWMVFVFSDMSCLFGKYVPWLVSGVLQVIETTPVFGAASVLGTNLSWQVHKNQMRTAEQIIFHHSSVREFSHVETGVWAASKCFRKSFWVTCQWNDCALFGLCRLKFQILTSNVWMSIFGCSCLTTYLTASTGFMSNFHDPWPEARTFGT